MLKQLIQPMNYTIVKDAMASVLLNEMENQVALAETAGMLPDDIDNSIYFNVFSSLWRPVNVKSCPAVAVYFEQGDMSDRSYPDRNWGDMIFNIDCFAVGQAGVDELGGIISTAEQNADARADFLIAQVYKILFSETNWYKGAKDIVREVMPLSIYRIEDFSLENDGRVILGKRLQLKLGFYEPTQQITSVELAEIYFSLQVRDEVIDPFVKILKT